MHELYWYLSVDPECSQAEIEQAYRRKMDGIPKSGIRERWLAS